MNAHTPRYNVKADAYILAWRNILHSKRLKAITDRRKLRQSVISQTTELLRGLRHDRA